MKPTNHIIVRGTRHLIQAKSPRFRVLVKSKPFNYPSILQPCLESPINPFFPLLTRSLTTSKLLKTPSVNPGSDFISSSALNSPLDTYHGIRTIWALRSEMMLAYERLHRTQSSSSSSTTVKAGSPLPNQSQLTPVRMRDSFIEAILPFHPFSPPSRPLQNSQGKHEPLPESLGMINEQSHAVMQLRYMNLYGAVRIGKLLEDLDLFSVAVGAKHCNQLFPKDNAPAIFLVTALVDQIQVERIENLPLDSPVKFAGCVTWVGRSSLEVSITLHQLRPVRQRSPPSDFKQIPPEAERAMHSYSPPPGFEWRHLLDARFLMVAKDCYTLKTTSVPRLDLRTKHEKEIFQRASGRNDQRKTSDRDSLLRRVPSGDEIKIVHDLFLATLDEKAGSLTAHRLPPNSLWIHHTSLKTQLICHPEDRNIHGKIFGGYLMRQAFELAWSSAHLHCRFRPALVAVDDFEFRVPVSIGSLLLLSSNVVYVHDSNTRHITIRVHAEVLDTSASTASSVPALSDAVIQGGDVPKEWQRRTTNTAFFVFKPYTQSSKPSTTSSDSSATLKSYSPADPSARMYAEFAQRTEMERMVAQPPTCAQLPLVYPDSYGASMLYLQGRRHYLANLHDRTDPEDDHWSLALL